MSTKQLATLEEHLNTGAPNPNLPDTNQRILDEDTYVDTLQHIITRDFYPDLYRLNRQNHNLDLYVISLSLSITRILAPSHDRHGTPGQDVTPTPIKQYQRHKAKQKKLSSATPTINISDSNHNVNEHNHNVGSPHPKESHPDTITNPLERASPEPDAVHNASDGNESGDDMIGNDGDLVHYVNGEMLSNEERSRMKLMNLKQFQNVYTSEDNYSFSEIMYKNQLEHFDKFPWIYEQQKDADDRSKYLSLLNAQETTISNGQSVAALEGPNPMKSITAPMGKVESTDTPSTKSNHKSNGKTVPKTKAISIAQDENGNNVVPADQQNVVRNDHKSKAQLDAEADQQRYREEKALQKKVDLYRGELMYWKFKSINKLMFFPEADREMNLQIMKRLQAQYGKPECVYTNTRFPKQFEIKLRNKALENMNGDHSNDELRGYEMVHTPRIKPGDARDDDTNDDNVEHCGTPLMTWGEVGGTPIALDDDDNPIGPIFKILKVPKKDRIVESLHKRNADKLRKKQEEKLRNTTPRNAIYTPYSTRQIVTPSGNHIHTPLVGTGGMDRMDTPMIGDDRKRQSGKKRKRRDQTPSRRPSSVRSAAGRYGARSIDDLSPAARKLMERSMKGRNGLSTPLSSKLREAYSSTPNRNGRKRTRAGTMSRSGSRTRRRDQEETPKLIMKETPKETPKAKRRRRNDDGFEKPKYSIKDKMKKRGDHHHQLDVVRKEDNRKPRTANLTDGLL